jgi:hypothetical protein
MVIELDRDSRACVERLFSDYPYLHGSIAAIIAGGNVIVVRDLESSQHLYIGSIGGEVVATGSLFVGSATCGIYDIVTHPDCASRDTR